MAAKKKTKPKVAPKNLKKLTKPKQAKKHVSAVVKPKPKPKSKPAPIVVAVELPSPPVVITYEMVARRAFLIWERKAYTNYPDYNWREAEAELRAELTAKK